MAEYRAIRSVIGHDGLRMNSTKSMIGHLLGGAGAVEAVATIKAIQTGEAPFVVCLTALRCLLWSFVSSAAMLLVNASAYLQLCHASSCLKANRIYLPCIYLPCIYLPCIYLPWAATAVCGFLFTGWVHPTINVGNPEEGVDPAVVCAGEKQQRDVKVGLSNSFGFGGHNSCVIFKKLEA
jgi:3-oxoacyl-(acyl-carrier-protein) synthase